MRLSYATAGALALCTAASAFSDSSPFALLSTAPFVDTKQGQQHSSSYVEQTTKDFLSSCPTERYLVVQQPNLSADELRDANSQSVPNLRRALAQENVAARWTVAGVQGEVSFSEITQAIKDACAKADRSYKLDEAQLPALPSDDSAARLADNDYILGESLRDVQAADSYTIVYLTTPAEARPLTASPVRPELKRRASPSTKARRDERDTRSLFDKYQFFNQGIFMTALGSLFLITIIAVGLNVLSGLTISYGAFAKDMGPAAQKKQQ